MRVLDLPSSTVLASVTALLVGACSGKEPTQPILEAESQLQAHAPRDHGAGASAVVLQVPDPATSYTGLDAAAASGTGGSLHLEVSANGPIPRFPDEFIGSVAVFGYAWADLDTGRGIVGVLHPVIGRDSRQNPDGWHTHPVQLGAGTGTSAFCVIEIGRSQGGINIQGDVLRLQVAEHWAGLSAGSLDVAASFTVQGDTECASGLGVAIIETAGL